MLRYVRSVRNETSSVNRLPPELLCSIFNFVYDPDLDNTRNAFRFSQVCQHWRTIAISYPPLWSDIYIYLRHIDAHAESLKRSVSEPLAVTILVPHIRKSEVQSEVDQDIQHRVKALDCVRLLAAHGPRIQSLYIALPVLAGHVMSMMDFPAPNLISFECVASGHVPYLQQCQLPETLFGGVVPRLKYLKLVDMDDSVLATLSNLTSLILATSMTGPWGEMNMVSFFSVLRRCPNLRFLGVEKYAFVYLNGQTPPELVTLPELTELQLVTSHTRVPLSRLELPGLVKLFVNRSLSGNGRMHPVFPDDNSRLPLVRKLDALSIVDNRTSAMVDIMGFTATGERNFIVSDLQNGVNARFHFFSTTIQYFTTISLINLTALTLDRGYAKEEGFKPITVEMMQGLYQSLPSLERLAIVDPFWGPVLEPLASSINGLLCPNLGTIVLCITSKTCLDIFKSLEKVVVARDCDLRIGCLLVLDPKDDADKGREAEDKVVGDDSAQDANSLVALWTELWNAHKVDLFVDQRPIGSLEYHWS